MIVNFYHMTFIHLPSSTHPSVINSTNLFIYTHFYAWIQRCILNAIIASIFLFFFFQKLQFKHVDFYNSYYVQLTTYTQIHRHIIYLEDAMLNIKYVVVVVSLRESKRKTKKKIVLTATHEQQPINFNRLLRKSNFDCMRLSLVYS